MAQLRNFQFLRNSINTIESFANFAAARTAAETAFAGITTLKDGEIALFSYKLDDNATKVHTLLGIKREGGIEIVANYDEIQHYVDTKISNLDSIKTGTDNGVSVTVEQVDGKIDKVTVVAPSLTNAIEALDVEAFSLTELDNTILKGYQIYEEDGIIKKGTTAETLLTFATAPTATNKVVTLKEIQDLDTPEGGVSSADTNNVKVTVTQVDGIVNTVTVVDNSVNATDVEDAIEDAIEEAIADLKSNVEDTNVSGDITVKVSQAEGKLTSVEVSDTLADVAHSGQASDVTVAEGINGLEATNVQDALAELASDIAALDAAQLEEGIGIAIDENNKINANFDIAIETRTEGEGESATTATYIVIKDGTNVIAEENANAFVKDGFLQSVTKDAANNTLIFTWNTDAGVEQTTIAISDLCDVYTAKENDWVVLNGFEFSHKTSGVTAGKYAANAADVTVNSTTSQSFKVPTLTVDAAGHVTAASEQTVTIALPASINTAVQTINGHDVNDSFITTTVTPSEGGKTQTIAVTATFGSVAANSEGFAEATEVKEYVDGKIDALKDYNTETTVSVATDGGIILDTEISGADTVAEQRTYTISLAPVTRVDNATEGGATGRPSESSFADDAKTFTYVKAVHTDANGRVTGIDTETVTENFDAGTYN